VFAARSLTEALGDQEAALASTAPDLDVTFSFAGSGTLVTQITGGAPADVIATADEESMATLVAADLVETPRTFARNRLAIITEPGNPKGITGLADLARPGLVVVLCANTVPAGRYTAEVLQRAGVTVTPRSRELDVKAAIAKVTAREADVTIGYVTDARAQGPRAANVEIPDEQNVVATYPVAILERTTNRPAAVAYVEDLLSGAGRSALQARGFVPAS